MEQRKGRVNVTNEKEIEMRSKVEQRKGSQSQ